MCKLRTDPVDKSAVRRTESTPNSPRVPAAATDNTYTIQMRASQKQCQEVDS